MALNHPNQNRLDFGDPQSVAEGGLQAVTAKFLSAKPFDWTVFEGFDRMRVLTYSVSTPMIVRMLDRYSFEHSSAYSGTRVVSGVSPK